MGPFKGVYRGYVGVYGGLGFRGLGFRAREYRDKGKENGSYYNGVI